MLHRMQEIRAMTMSSKVSEVELAERLNVDSTEQ